MTYLLLGSSSSLIGKTVERCQMICDFLLETRAKVRGLLEGENSVCLHAVLVIKSSSTILKESELKLYSI